MTVAKLYLLFIYTKYQSGGDNGYERGTEHEEGVVEGGSISAHAAGRPEQDDNHDQRYQEQCGSFLQ